MARRRKANKPRLPAPVEPVDIGLEDELARFAEQQALLIFEFGIPDTDLMFETLLQVDEISAYFDTMTEVVKNLLGEHGLHVIDYHVRDNRPIVWCLFEFQFRSLYERDQVFRAFNEFDWPRTERVVLRRVGTGIPRRFDGQDRCCKWIDIDEFERMGGD